MNLLLPEQDFWWVESEMTTQINRNMPKVCKRRLFVPRRAKYYGAIKWTAAIMVQGLRAVKDLKRYEIKPHWVPGRCFKDIWRWGKWGEATWRIVFMAPRKVCNCFFSGLWKLISIVIHRHPSLELQAWCVRWDYDRSDWPETVVSQFHLVCERWDKVSYILWLSIHHFLCKAKCYNFFWRDYLRSMSQSLYMAGIMIGSFVSGLLSGQSNHTKRCCVVVNRDIPLFVILNLNSPQIDLAGGGSLCSQWVLNTKY